MTWWWPWIYFLGGLVDGYCLFRYRYRLRLRSHARKARPMTEINIEAGPVTTIPVTLVGTRYEVRPPKAALAMRMAVEAKTFTDDPEKMMAVLTVWMKQAFGSALPEVRRRLEDPGDQLDITHIMSLMEKITEAQTATPTT